MKRSLRTEMTPNGIATYLSDNFRVYYPERFTAHKGKPYMILVCEELVEGRWEGFVSMRLVKPQNSFIH